MVTGVPLQQLQPLEADQACSQSFQKGGGVDFSVPAVGFLSIRKIEEQIY